MVCAACGFAISEGSAFCPKCGQRLAYVATKGDTSYYHCERDGTVILPPSGRLRVDKDSPGVH